MSKLSEARRRIQGMGMAEAQEELKTLRRRLFDLRLQLTRGEVKNNRQFPQIKADIARLMFHIGELNREELEGPAEEVGAADETTATETSSQATTTGSAPA